MQRDVTGTGDPTSRADDPPVHRSRLRAVALPSEHGGWSLTLEPVLLGLLVSWSWSGLLLGLAALLAFVARTSTKVVLVDRWRHRWSERTRLAAMVAAAELVLLTVLVVGAVVTAERPFWVPLVLAVPLVVAELWFDMRSRSRRLVPELAGAVGIGSVAAAVALAGGADTDVALGLWCVLAARSVAAIPFVRLQLQRGHGRPHRRWPSDLSQGVAIVVAAAGWAVGAVPALAVGAIVVLAAFDAVAARRPAPAAVVVGVQQSVLGLLVVVATAVGVALA